MKEGEQKMITLQEWKLIGITLIALFYISAIIYALIVEIVMRIKNKRKKSRSKQVTYQRPKKVFNARNFISNYDEFIAENTKGMTLFEIKEFKKLVNLELARMIG